MKPQKITLEQWKAAMLAKGVPRHAAGRGTFAPHRRRLANFIARLRWRLAGWVAGYDLDDL